MKVYRERDEITTIRRAIKTELTKLIDRPETELTVVDGMIKDDLYRVDIGEQMTLRAFTEEDGVTSFPVIIVTLDKRIYRSLLYEDLILTMDDRNDQTDIEIVANMIYATLHKKIESQGLNKYW